MVQSFVRKIITVWSNSFAISARRGLCEAINEITDHVITHDWFSNAKWLRFITNYGANGSATHSGTGHTLVSKPLAGSSEVAALLLLICILQYMY